MVWGLEKGSGYGDLTSGETENHKKAIKMTHRTLWHLNLLVWNYIHRVLSRQNMNRSILIKIYSVVIPAFSGTSPPPSVYAESFVSLSFKINSACVSIYQFVELILQLGEQNFVSCFSNIKILMLQKKKKKGKKKKHPKTKKLKNGWIAL